MRSIQEQIEAHMNQIVDGIDKNMEAKDLSNDQRVAICWVAGMRMSMSTGDTGTKIGTEDAVFISKNKIGWVISYGVMEGDSRRANFDMTL